MTSSVSKLRSILSYFNWYRNITIAQEIPELQTKTKYHVFMVHHVQ